MAEEANTKNTRRRTYSYVFITVSLVHTIPVEKLGDALRHKPGCRVFYSRWGNCDFSLW